MSLPLDHYHKLAMSSTAGLLQLSENWEPLEANSALLNMLEVESMEELRKIPVLELLAPEYRELFMREREKRHEGIASTYETVLLGKRGTRRNVIVSATPLMNDGTFVGSIATYADISDLRQSELVLRDTLERYRAVVTALGEGIAVISKSGEIVELNPSGQRIMGTPAMRFSSIFPLPAGWTICNEQGQQLTGEELPAGITLATGEPCRNVLLQMQRPDKLTTWLTVNTQPLFRPNEDMPYACVVSFHDVSQLKKAHDDLILREQRLARLLDAFPDLLFLLTLDGVFLDYRASRPELLLVPPEKFLGRNYADVMPEEVIEPSRQLFRKVIETGRTHSVEYSIKRNDSTIYREARATRLDTNTILMVVRDVTEAREADQRLRQHEQERAHLARLGALGEMVAGISHEINQPLHAIANFAAASLNKLQSGDENAREQVEIWLRKIASQAFRASEIVKRFRQFSSPAARTSTVSVSELVNESLELVTGEFTRRGVKCEMRNLAGDAPFVIDRIQLQQVLVNFLVNAGEAVEGNARQQRRVVVLAKIEHGKLVCEVADNGVGLPTVPMNQLFDAFFTTKPNGLGLGLPISRTIIESLGGRIWARNNDPRGAVFGFEIPQATRPQERQGI